MDLPKNPRVERRATRMHRMLERLGVDRVALTRLRNGESYAKARSICLSCGTSEKCLRWLDGEARPGSSPDFCPNLRLFEACKKEDASSS